MTRTHSFTITVTHDPDARDQDGNNPPPKFEFTPTGDGIQPLDCIDLCNRGIAWCLQAIEKIQQKQIEAIEAKVNKKRTESRVILPPGVNIH